MDEKAIQRAATVTLRRAILERFPPGRERQKWRDGLQRKRHPRQQGGAASPHVYVKLARELCHETFKLTGVELPIFLA
jgi:hypothetical protein